MEDNGLPAYASVCSSFSTIAGFATLQRGLVEAMSFPELDITCDDPSHPMIYNRATQRHIQ